MLIGDNISSWILLGQISAILGWFMHSLFMGIWLRKEKNERQEGNFITICFKIQTFVPQQLIIDTLKSRFDLQTFKVDKIIANDGLSTEIHRQYRLDH